MRPQLGHRQFCPSGAIGFSGKTNRASSTSLILENWNVVLQFVQIKAHIAIYDRLTPSGSQ